MYLASYSCDHWRASCRLNRPEKYASVSATGSGNMLAPNMPRSRRRCDGDGDGAQAGHGRQGRLKKFPEQQVRMTRGEVKRPSARKSPA